MTKETEVTTLFQMSDRTYDTLKGLVLYVLPGLASLYMGLAVLWGLPYAEPIAGSLTLLATFLGAIVGISKKKFIALAPPPLESSGDILVDIQEEGEDYLTLSLDRPVDEIKEQDTVMFKVVRTRAQTQE